MDIIADRARLSTHRLLADVAEKARDRLSELLRPGDAEDTGLLCRLHNSVSFPDAWRALRDNVREAQRRLAELGEKKLAGQIGLAILAFDAAWEVKLGIGAV